MKQTILALIGIILAGVGTICAQDEPSYIQELTSTDLQINQTDTALHFVGTASSNNIQLYIKGIEQGEYGDYSVAGIFQNLPCLGTGTYSYSEEYQSDCLVAYMDVDEMFVIKFTMYNATNNSTSELVVIEHITTRKQGSGPYANLVIEGNHATYGAVVVWLDGYQGGYGEYTIGYAQIGKTMVSGKGTWSSMADGEMLDATLTTANGSQTFHLIATTAKYTTDIDNITTLHNTKKRIYNNQLVILHEGVKYTIQGSVINN